MAGGATALQKQGKPAEALQFQQQAQKYADTQWDRELRDAMTKGHQGLADFMTRSQGGVFAGKKVAAVPSPDGKTVTYNVVNADGTMTPTPYTLPNDQNGVITAAYQLSKIDPETRYRHMVEEDKLTHQQNDRQGPGAHAARARAGRGEGAAGGGKIALSQATGCRRRQGGERRKKAQDKTDSEDRKRWTTLLDESGRRLSDSNKALRTLQRDPVFMARANKQGSPESLELQGLRDDVKRYDQDRATYQELLSRRRRWHAAASTPASPAAPRPPARRARCPRTQAARDAERVPILQAELVKAQQATASSDPAAAERARGDVASLQAELQRVGKRGADSNARQGGRQPRQPGGGEQPRRARQAAQGRLLQGPDGQVYIKQ
jgi:hypothetical protein